MALSLITQENLKRYLMNKIILILANLLFLSSTLLFGQAITHGPVTGAVTQSTAKVAYFADQSLSAELRYSKQVSFASYDSISANTDPNNGNYLQFNLSNLESNINYYHQVFIAGNPASDVGTFKTKPCDGESASYTFLFGSCQNENRNDDVVFAEMLKHPADFFLQIGDWGYPDNTDNLPNNNDFFPADYSRIITAYKNKYDYKNMKEYLKTVWIDYVWDDHDYVNDNSSRNTASYTKFGLSPTLDEIPFPPGTRRNAISAYYEMFPSFEPVDSSEGIYHKFRYGNMEIFMLDNRAPRDPGTASIQKINGRYVFAPPPGHSIIGAKQREWLLENLKKSTATWKFITTATAFNKSYRDAIVGVLNLPSLAGLPLAAALIDSWSGYPMDQDSIIEMVNREKIDGVIMMSGDTHTTGIDDGQAGGLPEIMAGCLSQTNSALFTTVPLLVYGLTWSEGGQGIGGNTNTKNSFGKISVDGDNSATLELIDQDGGLIADYKIYSCSYYSGLDLQVANIYHSKCYGDSTTGAIQVVASGGTAPYKYTLDGDNYQSTPLFTNLSAGKYQLAIKDATGCSKEICFSIEEADSISINVLTTDAICNGTATGSALLQVSGGVGSYNYTWSNSANPTVFDTSLTAGNYTVTVVDGNLCTKQINFRINEADALSYSAITEAVNCDGSHDGIATIVPQGGTSPIEILWADNSTTFTNNQLSAGYQTFSLKDSNSCMFSDSVFIADADSLYINPIVTADNGRREGSIILNPQGGTKPYLYLWQGPSNSDTLRNISAGNYTLSLIDANGCIVKTSVDVPFDSLPVTSIDDIANQKLLKVYPNPSSDKVYIEWTGEKTAEEIQIFDIKGVSVWTSNNKAQTTNKQSIEVGRWAPGIYFVQIKLKDTTVVKRFVVE